MSTLINLEEPFKSRWRKGYLQTHPNGRRYICLFNSDDDRSLVSYARYLLSVRQGQFLPDEIEADHRDNDPANDSPDNIQPLSGKDNKRKERIARNGLIVSDLSQKCEVCGVEFKHCRKRLTCGKPACKESILLRERKNGKRLTDDQKQQIAERLVNGDTYDAIKSDLKVSNTTIARHRPISGKG